MLKEQIENDLKNAMKEKKQLELDTLRMLRARLKNEEIAKQKEFGDPEISEIIASEVKRRKDSADSYREGSREELAQKEEAEILILMKYMPEQLSEEEVRQIITDTLAGQNLVANDFGKAMGMVMPKLKGKTTGDIVSKLLKETLK